MEFFKIGIISGTNGLKGALNISVEENYLRNIKKNGFVFIEISKGSFIPYQIIQINKSDKENAVISFEEFTSLEAARTISGKFIYLEKNQLSEGEQNFVGTHLSDFEIIDQEKGSLGKIVEIYELPGQLIATIIIEEKEIMIPLNDDFIIEINPKKKYIKLNLPEGLLEI